MTCKNLVSDGRGLLYREVNSMNEWMEGMNERSYKQFIFLWSVHGRECQDIIIKLYFSSWLCNTHVYVHFLRIPKPISKNVLLKYMECNTPVLTSCLFWLSAEPFPHFFVQPGSWWHLQPAANTLRSGGNEKDHITLLTALNITDPANNCQVRRPTEVV